MIEGIIVAQCGNCDFMNQLGGSELRLAIDSAPSRAQIEMNCMNCARISLIPINMLPATGKLTTTEWVAQSIGKLNNSWLPCILYMEEDAKLPVGAYIEPGDLLIPRLWKYKNANLDKGPDNSVWWTWEGYAINWRYDPFLKLALMRGPAWKKAMFGDQEPHHRTRVIVNQFLKYLIRWSTACLKLLDCRRFIVFMF